MLVMAIINLILIHNLRWYRCVNAYQVLGLLLSRRFKSHSRKLITKILDPLFHNFLWHQIYKHSKNMLRQDINI